MKLTFIPLLFWLLQFQKVLAFGILPSEQDKIISLKLIFNQSKYVAGDTAFFSGYLHGIPAKWMLGKRIVGLSLIASDGEIILYKRFPFQNGTVANQIIVPATVPAGGYWLSADIEGLAKNIELKTIFIISDENELVYESKPIRSDRLPLDIKTNKEEYSPRAEVKVSVESFAEKRSPFLVSISVNKKSLFSTANDSLNYLVDKGVYDLSAIVSEDIFTSKVAPPNYFSGKAVFSFSKLPVPDSTQLVFYLNRNDFVYQVYTRNNGQFEFRLFKDFSDDDIFCYAYGKKGRIDSVQLILDMPRSGNEKIEITETNTRNEYTHYTKQVEEIMDSYGYFLKGNTSNQNSNSDWWPDVDYEIDLSKYEAFYSIEEVFTNIVPLVKFRRGGDEEGARIFLEKIAGYTNKNPLFIIDGVMTDNAEYVNTIDPLHVLRIGVCRSEELLLRYGKLGINGIIAIETDRKNEILPLARNSFLITGISKSLNWNQLYDDDYSISNNRIPHLKSVLYWNPSMKIPEFGKINFSFFTSDDLGYYEICIVGVSGGEELLVKNYLIRVVEKTN